jgi:hypothetical protein
MVHVSALNRLTRYEHSTSYHFFCIVVNAFFVKENGLFLYFLRLFPDLSIAYAEIAAKVLRLWVEHDTVWFEYTNLED